ncbi:MAG: GatB/YqeY domain-containing protein [Gammaproteobacteria bacterium]|nr:MAG: GatB/YqeY domain-containing protein [Gammaproteobacteria bacterium]
MMLSERIKEDMKSAMRAKDKVRLGAIRMILSAFKQYEVDEQAPVTDEVALKLLDKMLKQRRDSVAQYEQAGREDLAEKERAEMAVIQSYLPAPLSSEELEQLIDAAISETGAETVRDMGRVMNVLRPKIQGRADMGQVGQLVKQKLN